MNSLTRPSIFTLAVALLTAAVFLATSGSTAWAGGGPTNVLVVINTRSDDSKTVGEYYAKKRDIPECNICRVACPTDLTIPYDVFRAKIMEPIRRHIIEKKLGEQIDYIVTTQGMPIRVNVGDFSLVSAQAILVLMDTDVPGTTQATRPKFNNAYINAAKAFYHKDTYGQARWHLYCVTSLQAYTAEDAKGLVDRAIESDKGPQGKLFIFQDADGNAKTRNEYYSRAADMLKKVGMETECVASGPDVVINRKAVIGYMNGGCYSRLEEAKLKTNQFVPGALVDALQSYGAPPQNFDPKSGPAQFPITYFIRCGVTIVHGCVAEPYTLAFPSAILFQPYVEGFNAAETFYMTIPPAYWMNMVCGDPLVQPFAKRPGVVVTNRDVLEAPVKNEFEVQFEADKAAAAKAQRFEIFLDGVRVASLPSSAKSHKIDATKLKNGKHDLRVVAIAEAPTDTQAYVKIYVNVANDSVFVTDVTPQHESRNVLMSAPVRVEFNRPIRRDESSAISLKVTAGGKDVAGNWEYDYEAGLATFEPQGDGLPPAEDIEIRVAHQARELSAVTFHTTVKALALGGVAKLRAGEKAAFTINAADPKYSGRVALAVTDAKAEFTATKEFTPAEGGVWKTEIEFRTAGEFEVAVKDADSGAEGRMTVTVAPGESAGVFLEVPKTHPLGAPLTVRFFAADKFGNPLDSADYSGMLTITDADGSPVLRKPVTLDKASGRGAERDIELPKLGAYKIALDPGSSASVELEDTGVPHCLVLGPFNEADPKKRFDTPFIDEERIESQNVTPYAVDKKSGKLWRPLQAARGQKAFNFQDVFGAKGDNAVAYALVYISAQKAADVAMLLGSDEGVKVWVNGKLVHQNNVARGYKADEDRVGNVHLKQGLNTVLFKITNTSGGFGFGFRLVTPGMQTISDVSYRLAAKGEPTTFTLTGLVRSGLTPVPNITVELRPLENGQPGNAVKTAKSEASGLYRFENLAAGRYQIVCKLDGTKPAKQIVAIFDEHVSDVNFDTPDVIAPVVALKVPEKLIADADAEATVTENAKIKSVQFFLDGKPFGPAMTDAPFSVAIGPKAVKPGKHKLKAVAIDSAGNEGVSPEVKFEVVIDKSAPRIAVKWPSAWKGDVVLDVKAVDNIEVAKVEVFLDGKSLATGKADVKATVKCGDIKDTNVHELVIESKDTAGNVERETRRFKVTK